MRKLPTPDQILEELADKAAANIDRLAPVAFDNAWDEMIRYHRFLLAINATTLPDGSPINYAEVAGEAWHAPHHDWIKQYARLFERAADRIPDDGHFIRLLAYAPLRLLPKRDEPALSINIMKAILNLGPMMMHRIEAWKTKRTTVENSIGQAAQPRLTLAGSDAKSYADVLPSLVGAWEALLQAAPAVFNWRDDEREDDGRRWIAFRASWPFLWQHLSNTAHCLAAAVWNEDEEGARLYREALIRWPETLGRRHPYSELRHRRHLFPDALERSWEDAKSTAAKLAYEFASEPHADELFTTIVGNVHDDVILLSSALLLSWPMNNKLASDIGARTARALLARDGGDDNRGGRAAGRPSFHTLLLDFFRLESAGERHVDGSYANELDRMLMSMDTMTERRVVPGRVFTPSTINGREDLILSFLTILVTFTPETGDDGSSVRIEQLAKDVDVLPRGDRALRGIIEEIVTLQKVLNSAPPTTDRLDMIAPMEDVAQSVTRFGEILEALKEKIDAVRLDRLKRLPVDPVPIERLRVAAQGALLKGPASLPFFTNVRVVKNHDVGTSGIESASISGIHKAQLVAPVMETPPVNFDEAMVSYFQDAVERRIWQAFMGRTRERVEVGLKVEQGQFWRSIAPFVARAGPRPVLMVSRQAEGRAFRRFVWSAGAGDEVLDITRKEIVDGLASYIATVQGVDVFGANFPAGLAWLFSGELLEKISYGAISLPEKFVNLEFQLSDENPDELSGLLRFHYRPEASWTNGPIFELHTPDPDELDVENDLR